MDLIAILREIDRLIAERQTSRKAVCRAAGVNETYLRDLAKGRSANPKTDQLGKIAQALGTSLPALLSKGAVHAPAVTVGQRLRWVREEIERNADRIAQSLNIDLDEWGRYERGEIEPPGAVLLDFCDLIDPSLGVSPRFLYRGEMADLADPLRRRLVAKHPELAVSRVARHRGALGLREDATCPEKSRRKARANVGP